VLVTDHHLPGETLPAAEAIVNPNLRDCDFPSKWDEIPLSTVMIICAPRA
jgi:hypothetical protein